MILGPERISKEVKEQLVYAVETDNSQNDRYLVALVFLEEHAETHLVDTVRDSQKTDETYIRIKGAILDGLRQDPKREV